MRPISFLFIDTERVWRGGQDQLFTLLRGLIARGHTVQLVCHPATLLEERARGVGVSVYPLAVRNEWDLLAFGRLLGLLRRLAPEVLAFNTPRAILIGSLASRFAPVPVRIIFRRVNFPLKRNIFTRLKYNLGIDAIIAISESIQHQLEKCGVSPGRIRRVYEGLEPETYRPRPFRDPRADGSPVVVGTVGHMSQEKGHRYLVEAAALVPDVRRRLRFVLVGDGECRGDVEALVRLRGLEDCFEFTGFQSEVARHLESFDIFVLPSLSEGLSSAILAAMAASLPVVATEVGGIPELVRPGENGILVPPADPAALARAIQELADEPARAHRLGANGRRRVELQFTLERKIAETESICAGFLRTRPAQGVLGSP